MNRSPWSLFPLKADFCASLTASITSPISQIAAPAIIHGPKPGGSSSAEQVGDRQHDDRNRDRLQEPETGEAKRLVPHLVEAVIDLDPQDPPEQVDPQPRCPDEDEERGDELNRLARARERQDDREHREGEAVGEVSDDVGLADRRDHEEGRVHR